MTVYFWLYVLSVVLAAGSQILLKVAAGRSYPGLIRQYLNPWVISGYGILVISMLLTVLAYKGLPYKNGPVIESLGYVLVLLLSRLFFREKLTKSKIGGTLLILAGILVFYI